MTRDELIAVIDDLVRVIDPDPARILDAVEPLIRADERELVTDVLMRATEDGMVQAIREWKAELRAKVEALPACGVVYPHNIYSLVPETLLYRTDVLNLLDEAAG